MDDETKEVVIEEETQLPDSPKDKKSMLAYVAVLVVCIIGGLLFFNKKELRSISMDEIGTHNSKDSCWTSINDGVYNVTKFVSVHKGGDKILAVCGIDGTDLFTGKSPMGRVHSEVAVKLLSSMKIGTLQK